MAKYAVVRISGKQYKVTEGKEILVDKLVDPKKFDVETLLIVDGDPTSPSGLRGASKVRIGKPVLKDAKVTVKVITDLEKGEKVEIYKFKAKSRYKRHTGFRPQYTRLLVEKIA